MASSGGGLKSISVSLLELSPGSASRESAFTLSDRGGVRLGVRGVVGLEEAESGACEFGGAELEELEVCAHTAMLHPITKMKSKLRIP